MLIFIVCLEDDPKLHKASGLFLIVLAIDISRLWKKPMIGLCLLRKFSLHFKRCSRCMQILYQISQDFFTIEMLEVKSMLHKIIFEPCISVSWHMNIRKPGFLSAPSKINSEIPIGLGSC